MTRTLKSAKLGDVADVQSGGTPSISNKAFWGGGIPWYSSGELNTAITGAPKRTISAAGIAASNAKLFPTGSLLIGMYDTAALKMSILDRDAAFNQAIAGVKPNDIVNMRFVFYALNAVKEELLGQRRGVRQKNLSLAKVRDFPIPILAVAEQRRIVAILDAAFEAIATVKANAERNLQNARELFDSHLRSVFADGGASWLSATIDRHIRFIDYRGRTPEKTSQGLRLITAKNVKKGFIQREPIEFVAPDSYDRWMTRGIPKVGDVLFTTEAPLGNVAQLDTEDRVVFAQRVIIMQANPAVLDSTFLKYMLLSAPVQTKIHAQATGATAQGIKASLLKRIEVTFPQTLAEQRAIVDRLDALAEASNRLEELYANKLESLDELKRTLLHQAFSGELPAESKSRQTLAAVA